MSGSAIINLLFFSFSILLSLFLSLSILPVAAAADRPELSLQLGTTTLSLQSIQEGNDIYFDCVVDASPMPVGSIVWRFNNEEILEPRQGRVAACRLICLN